MSKISYIFMGLFLLGTFSYAEVAKDKPKLEHYAISSNIDYLDGPRLQGFGSDKGRISCNDAEGNVFFMWKYSAAWLRCISIKGQLKTICGDNRWPSDLKGTEGPAAYFPHQHGPGGAGATCFPDYGIWAEGLPLEGEEKGCLYIYWKNRSPYKIFKNKEEGGRWWFRRLGDPSKSKPPSKNGESALVADVNLSDAIVGDNWIYSNGNLYDHDSKKGRITCVLAQSEYESKVTALLDKRKSRRKTGAPIGPAEHIGRDTKGNIYLLFYLKNYPVGSVFKVSADRTKIELLVQHDDNAAGKNLDGPGRGTKWHAGPAWMRMSGDIPLLRSIDSATVRRLKDGRVSHLCMDGEWRERLAGKRLKHISTSGYQPADHGLPYVFIHYPGETSGNDTRFLRYGPVDYKKDTIGPKVPDYKEGK